MESIHIGPNKYFNDNEILFNDEINNNYGKTSEKIILKFYLINPDEGIFSIQGKLYDNQARDYFSELAQSQNHNNIEFLQIFTCDFILGKDQILNIILNKNEKPLLSFDVNLNYIINKNNGKCIYNYGGNKSIKIIAIRAKSNNESVNFRFKFDMGKNNSQKLDYFKDNKMYYVIESNFIRLYDSGLIADNGIFDPVHIPDFLLQQNYEVKFYLNNQFLNSFKKSLKELPKDNISKSYYGNNNIIKFTNPNNYNQYFNLYDNSEISKNYTLREYIDAGVKIALSIGIDFTDSNNQPFPYKNLHSIGQNKPNDYELAFLSCGYIIGYYDDDQLFPVYGFGAKINNSYTDEVSMCFNLNFKNNPNIEKLDNVIKTYHKCIKENKLTFSNQYRFAPLLRKVISLINKKDLFEYHILMILTTGVINDLQETIDIIVEASTLPLSIVIIGMGDNNDFINMEKLDGDVSPLISSKGNVRKRDLVQFVPFKDYRDDPKKLSMEVLAELPRQAIEYYQLKDINPAQIKAQLSSKNSNPSIISNIKSTGNKNPNPVIDNKINSNNIINDNPIDNLNSKNSPYYNHFSYNFLNNNLLYNVNNLNNNSSNNNLVNHYNNNIFKFDNNFLSNNKNIAISHRNFNYNNIIPKNTNNQNNQGNNILNKKIKYISKKSNIQSNYVSSNGGFEKSINPNYICINESENNKPNLICNENYKNNNINLINNQISFRQNGNLLGNINNMNNFNYQNNNINGTNNIMNNNNMNNNQNQQQTNDIDLDKLPLYETIYKKK